jgi:hypothetical protein
MTTHSLAPAGPMLCPFVTNTTDDQPWMNPTFAPPCSS